MNIGIYGDEQRRKENEARVAAGSDLMLCGRCDGTGNELYSMYRQCAECGGVGVGDREPERSVSDERET